MKNAVWLLFFCCCGVVNAQQLSPDTVITRLWQQIHCFPQEKLYLHTDKNEYVAGEKIWMKAYTVNATTHHPDSSSRYVYVDLINPFNQVALRKCFQRDSLQLIHGAFPLDDTLPGGEYTLRAYTRYMQNKEEAYFFKKRLRIYTPISQEVELDVQEAERNTYVLQCVNRLSKKPLDFNTVQVWNESEKVWTRQYERKAVFKLNPEHIEHPVVLAQIGNCREYLPLRSSNGHDCKISFLPEGGELIEGVVCKVAFKAINNEGYGEPVSGVVLNGQQDTVTVFRSLHQGMGTFSFIPQAGTHYTARYTDSSGTVKETLLPQAEKTGYSLQIMRRKSDYYVSVLHRPGMVVEPLLLIAHQRGIPRYAQLWDFSLQSLKFSETDFASGIIHFLLVDLQGNIRSERLAFRFPSGTEPQAVPDKPQYAPRHQVKIELLATDEFGKPWEGSASIAVTDNADVLPDSCCSLPAHLLLASELKGYVEAPHWYFRCANQALRQEAIDVLMLTQGWRRYHLPELLKGKFEYPQILPETSMAVTGKVTSGNKDKPVEKMKVRILSPKINLLGETMTDKDGRFRFDGIEFTDTADFWVFLPVEDMKRNTKLSVYSPPIPSACLLPASCTSFNMSNDEREYHYLQKANGRIINGQGIRHVYMEEVTVTALAKKYNTEYERFATNVISEEKIRKSGSLTIEGVIRSTLGSHLLNSSQIVFDGVLCELGETRQFILQNLSPNDIQQIDVIKPPATIGFFPNMENNSLIFITTKRGYTSVQRESRSNTVHIDLTGYTKDAEFYSPQYDSPEKQEGKTPDLRTVIHWEPDIRFRNGRASVTFYTADAQSTYSYVAEGVSDSGCTLHLSGEIEVKTP